MGRNPAKVKELAERIRVLAAALGGQNVLANLMGWSQSHTSQYCTGHRTPGWETLDEIPKKTGCNPCYLMGECATPFAGSCEGKEAVAIDTYVTGGGSHWMLSDQLEPYRTEIPHNLTAYEVRGDSMEPLARDGQIIIAMSGIRATDGDLALIEFHDGGHTFKRIYRQGTQILLTPVNPNHKPEIRRVSEMRYAWKVWGIKF